jgi:Zn-dependent protease with chaperone function
LIAFVLFAYLDPQGTVLEPSALITAVLPDVKLKELEFGWLRLLGYAITLWLSGLPILFLTGVFLGQLTWAAVERGQALNYFKVRKPERLARTAYRIVIVITCLDFYASILILVLVLTTLLVASLLLHLSLLLLLFLIWPELFALITIARSFLVWARAREPGYPLSCKGAPALWSLVKDVGEHVGARPVDAIYITPGCNISVLERGSLWAKLRGASQRCLVLGLGILPGMTQTQFKAILAHEYGHFFGRDTVGNNFEQHVRFSMDRMIYTLLVEGLARWHNPVWLLLNGFNRLFLRVTLGASRLREVFADRYAAMAYGTQNLVDALAHIVYQNQAFSIHVSREVDLATRMRWNLKNLYIDPTLSEALLEQLQAKVDAEMNRPTSPYDSHPSIKDRIKLLQQLDIPDNREKVKDGQEPVWDLFLNVKELQQMMTRVIQADARRWQELRVLWGPRRPIRR